jgi:hypothetical protein
MAASGPICQNPGAVDLIQSLSSQQLKFDSYVEAGRWNSKSILERGILSVKRRLLITAFHQMSDFLPYYYEQIRNGE